MVVKSKCPKLEIYFRKSYTGFYPFQYKNNFVETILSILCFMKGD